MKTSRLFISLIACAVAGAFVNPSMAQVKIGFSEPVSGAGGDYITREVVNPGIFAIEEINAAGGVLGHKVEYVVEDNKGNAATALAVAGKLIDVDKVNMIAVSPSPAALATLPLAEEHHVQIVTVSQHPKIIASPWGAISTPSSAKFGVVQARYAYKDLNARTASLLYENNDAIRVTAEAFKTEFQSLGGKVVESAFFKSDEQDFRGQLTKARAANADVFLPMAISSHPIALIVKQAIEMEFKPKYTISIDQITDPEVRQVAGDLISTFYYATVDFDHSWNDKKFKPRFGYDADGFAARTYDGVRIYLAAVEKAGTTDPEKVREVLYHTKDFHGVVGTWGYAGTGEAEMYPVMKKVQ